MKKILPEHQPRYHTVSQCTNLFHDFVWQGSLDFQTGSMTQGFYQAPLLREYTNCN